MLFVLSSKRTDVEALLCWVATAKTCQPVGFTSQVIFLVPHHRVLPRTAATGYLCPPPRLSEAMVGSQEPWKNWGAIWKAGVTF